MIGRIDIEKTLQLQPNKECLFVSVATILNELVDAVNELQEQMDLVGEDLEEALKVKKVDQNLNFAQPEVKENVLTKSLRMDKEFVEEEIDRTRKALDIAVDALKTVRRYTAINQFAPKSREAHIVAKKAVAEITALEQKD